MREIFEDYLCPPGDMLKNQNLWNALIKILWGNLWGEEGGETGQLACKINEKIVKKLLKYVNM